MQICAPMLPIRSNRQRYLSGHDKIKYTAGHALSDQTSGLGLHCLLMSHKKDARLKWVNKDMFCSVFFMFSSS